MTLNPDGWRRVESLFHAAADLPDDAREALLAGELEQSREVVDAVRRMLAADGPHALLDADAFVTLRQLGRESGSTDLRDAGDVEPVDAPPFDRLAHESVDAVEP